jgi:oligoendopeptidase F
MQALFQPERATRRASITNEVAFCDEKIALTMQFMHTVHELTALQKRQLEALVNSDPDFEQFHDLIEEAVERKNQAKDALVWHIESHACAE